MILSSQEFCVPAQSKRLTKMRGLRLQLQSWPSYVGAPGQALLMHLYQGSLVLMSGAGQNFFASYILIKSGGFTRPSFCFGNGRVVQKHDWSEFYCTACRHLEHPELHRGLTIDWGSGSMLQLLQILVSFVEPLKLECQCTTVNKFLYTSFIINFPSFHSGSRKLAGKADPFW